MRVDRVRAQDWQTWRAIRLEALEDTPIGFLELLADARRHPDQRWQQRAAAMTEGDASALWLAWDGDAAVGLMGAARYEPEESVLLLSVYVRPPARGADVLDRLVEAAADWARTLRGVTALRLEVHEDNLRARAAYEKRGFVLTGTSAPYSPDPTRQELEMVRPL